MVKSATSDALASFLEENLSQLLNALVASAEDLGLSVSPQLVHEWLESQVSYLRGGPGHASDWIALMVEQVGARDEAFRHFLSLVRQTREVFLDFFLGQVAGVSPRDVYSIILEAQDEYVRLAADLYAERQRRKLVAERRKQNAMVEAMAYAFVSLDGAGNVILTNSFFVDLLGVREEDIAGQPLTPFCDEKTAEEIRRELRVRRPTPPRTVNGSLVTSAGERLERILQLIPMFNEHGMRDGLGIVLTTQNQQEAAPDIVVQARLLEGFAESLGVGLHVVDRQNTVVAANESGRAYAGLVASDADGNAPQLCCREHPSGKEECGDCFHSRVFESGEPYKATVVIPGANEENRWIEITALPLYGPDGQVTHVARSFRDVSGQRRLEDQLLQQQRSSLVSQIAMTVAHQLRNPLGIMIGFAEMLSKEGSPEQFPEAVERILRNGLRCKEIVENLLEFGQGVPAEQELTDINTVVRQRVQSMYPGSLARHITWKLASHLPLVECGPHQLAQVFVNLLDNALWACRSQVVFETKAQGDKVITRVWDDGSGVPEDYRRHVFEPFFTTRKDEGNIGLGLSLSRSVIQEHRGALYLDEAAPEGACFVVELPAAQDDLSRAEVQDSRVSTQGEAKRVLIVDDEVDLLELLSTALQMQGHKVDSAANGTRALELLRQGAYDLAILDILLPGELGGRELYQIILGTTPQLTKKTIFITADTMNYETRRFLDEVGCPFMEKPFMVADFIARVNEMLRNPA